MVKGHNRGDVATDQSPSSPLRLGERPKPPLRAIEGRRESNMKEDEVD
jgi:hypothetical protein